MQPNSMLSKALYCLWKLFLTGKKRRDRCKKTSFFLKEGSQVSFQSKATVCWWQVLSHLTKQTADRQHPAFPLETNASPAGSAFQQSMHTLTNTHTCTMLHAKASVEKREYQLSIKYMLSFPDAVRLQVINFTFERFPITNACAPLITTHQQGRGTAQNSCSTLSGNTTQGINDWPWSQDINLWGTDFCSKVEQQDFFQLSLSGNS